jgi:hypothetical protein
MVSSVRRGGGILNTLIIVCCLCGSDRPAAVVGQGVKCIDSIVVYIYHIQVDAHHMFACPIKCSKCSSRSIRRHPTFCIVFLVLHNPLISNIFNRLVFSPVATMAKDVLISSINKM